ncbi:hypothetical protein B1B_13730, partial [mine drainage metagenome]
PGARTLSDRNLLILDCGDAEANARARALFAHTSLTITEVPLEQHDRLMAEVLSLPHAMSLLFGRGLAASGHRPEELAQAAPTSYRRHAEVARIVTQENPELAFDIQTLNPATAAMLERLARALRELQDAVTRPDAAAYLHQLGEARLALGAGPFPSVQGPVPKRGRQAWGEEYGPATETVRRAEGRMRRPQTGPLPATQCTISTPPRGAFQRSAPYHPQAKHDQSSRFSREGRGTSVGNPPLEQRPEERPPHVAGPPGTVGDGEDRAVGFNQFRTAAWPRPPVGQESFPVNTRAGSTIRRGGPSSGDVSGSGRRNPGSAAPADPPPPSSQPSP